MPSPSETTLKNMGKWVPDMTSAWQVMNTSWWRHQMEPFSALLAICAGISLVSGGFPAQKLVTQSFDVFFDLRMNKRLGKQSRRWWFETPSRSLWRHCNDASLLLLLFCISLKYLHGFVFVWLNEKFLIGHPMSEYHDSWSLEENVVYYQPWSICGSDATQDDYDDIIKWKPFPR